MTDSGIVQPRLTQDNLTSLQSYILVEEQRHPGASGDFSWILSAIALACKTIANKVRRARIEDVIGDHDDTNTHGEQQYRDENQDHFEVVFVSSDRTPDAHKEYMEETEMKWYTLKHRGEDSAALSKKYGVRGIPTLVILRSDGSLLTSSNVSSRSTSASMSPPSATSLRCMVTVTS